MSDEVKRQAIRTDMLGRMLGVWSGVFVVRGIGIPWETTFLACAVGLSFVLLLAWHSMGADH